MAEEAKSQGQDDDKAASPAGGVWRRAGRVREEGDEEEAGRRRPQGARDVLDETHEVLKVATDVAAADVAVPAGFKESK